MDGVDQGWSRTKIKPAKPTRLQQEARMGLWFYSRRLFMQDMIVRQIEK
jgi:hypothetical protein